MAYLFGRVAIAECNGAMASGFPLQSFYFELLIQNKKDFHFNPSRNFEVRK
jgi:hypothetical protein